MLSLIAGLAYALFALATGALVWAVSELARAADAEPESRAGANPHATRF